MEGDAEIQSFQRAQSERWATSIDIEGHPGRKERMDIDFGTCLGCMLELQPLVRIVTVTGHKWRCPPCKEAGK